MTSEQVQKKELQITKENPCHIPDGFPIYVDWRKKNVLRDVLDQGRMLVVESVWSLKYKKPLPRLSAQMLVDCIHTNPPKDRQDGYGCYTLTVVKALNWLTKNEVFGEDDYPYQDIRGKCRSSDIIVCIVILLF
ncbi:hypothetical protein REPUB_Repub03eG0069500 [Reevesia pubescens]